MRIRTPSPLVTPRGIALSQSEKRENLVDNLQTQFLPVSFPSVLVVIVMVDVAIQS
jgi:hypothetical protein